MLHRPLSLLALCGCGLASSPSFTGGAATDVAEPDTGTWSAALEADARAIQPVGAGVFGIGQPGWGLSAQFAAEGAVVRSAAGGEVRIATTAWGREGSLEALDPVSPELGQCLDGSEEASLCPRRLVQGFDGVDAWWQGGQSDLRQGWEVAERPPGVGDLVVRVSVSGPDRSIAPEGDFVSVLDPSGREWVMRDLAAWDADGAPLAARFEVTADGVDVHVDDAGAVYPVTIDPVLGTASTILAGSAANTYFGYSVATLGDVNGDGYDDVAVGSYGVSFATGRVYVYHGSAAGLGTTPATTLSGVSTSGRFGVAVSAAGDVNGDGFGDLLVGADAAASNGAAYLYLGSATGIGSSPAASLAGEASGSQFGGAVGAAGDTNGDGYGDVLVGAPSYSSAAGRAYLYLGSATGLTATPAQTWTGTVTYAYLGRSVASAGDVNGDGRDDVLVGAYGVGAYEGAAYLYIGGAFGASAAAAASWSGATGEYDGFTVAGVGDLNRDGYDDVALSATGWGPDAASGFTGTVRIYEGSATGPSVGADRTLVGEDSGDYFGWSVTHGDFDADGYGDVAISSPVRSSGTGRVYVYRGGVRGLATSPDTVLDGLGSSAYFGVSVAAGDLNGDGVSDLVAGAYGVSSSTGAAYVYAGQVDADGDGYGAGTDCDDADPAVNPGAVERVGDQIDQDCDGAETCYLDADSDGYRPDAVSTVHSDDLSCTDPGEALLTGRTGDCDDADASVSPGATEIVGDGIDQDCDNADSCYTDSDGDGYRTDRVVRSTSAACTNAGEAPASAPGGDCDDGHTDVHPGATEVVSDGVDQDCDGGDVCYVDADGDRFRPDTTSTVASADLDCGDAGEAPESALTGDCDDTDSSRNPSVREGVGDGVDSDCDGGEACYVDGDGDGYRPNATDTVASADADCADAGEAMASATVGDCNDADTGIHAGASEIVGDEIDQDCDGGEICFVDVDGDGYRPDDTSTVSSTNPICSDRGEATGAEPTGDCNDSNPAYHPAAEESDCADPNDYNCDGSVGYADADGDLAPACEDCDDSSASVYPDAVETCDGIDDNCDGVVDGPDAVDGSTWYPDADGDGYTPDHPSVTACDQPSGYYPPSESVDCDDSRSGTHPGATDYPNDGHDQDCDGSDFTGGDGGKDTGGDNYGGGCTGCSSGTAGDAREGWLAGLLLGGLALRRRARR